MLRSPTPRDWLTLLALVAAWGSSFALSKFAVRDMDASWIVAGRMVVAALFLLAVLTLRGGRLPRRPALWAWFASLGVLGHSAPFWLITWGIRETTSGVAGVLMGSIPLLIIVAAHLFLPDERLTRMKALGFVLGFIGLIVILDPAKLAGFSGLGAELIGELAIVAACLCYTGHALAARRIPFDGPLAQATAVSIAGAIVSLAVALIVAPGGYATTSSSSLIAVVALGILPTAIGSLLLYRLARSVGVSFASYSNYLVPVFALAAGAIALGETLTFDVGLGLILILGGIAVSRMTWKTDTGT